jgi:hypothetical protein
MTPEYEVIDQTRGWRQRSRDLLLIIHLHALWVLWGHSVVITRVSDPAPVSSSPTFPVPRA